MSKRILPKICLLQTKTLPSLLALSQEAGWPHTERDWTAVLECGVTYGHQQQDGVVTSCVHLNGDKRFASLGLMLVKNSSQKQGMGRALLENVLSRTSTPIGLIAGTKVSGFYEPFGFQTIDEHVLVLRKNVAPRLYSTGSCNIRPVSTRHLQGVLDFDRSAAGVERTKLLHHRLLHADCSLVYLESDEDNSPVHGYGMANIQGDQMSVGPLVSVDASSALQLTKELTADFEGPLRIDVYESQSEFVESLVQDEGYEIASRQPVMMKGGPLKLPGNRQNIFSPASQAWL